MCCSELTIDTPEFKKVQGVLCPHCMPGKGCGIYPDWFPVCRTWFCQWRRYAWLDDAWRPDRSRLLLRATDDEVPGGYASAAGVALDLHGPCEILLEERVIEVIGRLVDARVPTFLSVPGRPGHAGGRVFLNPLLALAVGDRDGDAIGRGLVDAFLRAVLHPQEAIAL